jgi:hypothetical protein
MELRNRQIRNKIPNSTCADIPGFVQIFIKESGVETLLVTMHALKAVLISYCRIFKRMNLMKLKHGWRCEMTDI